MKDMDRIIIFEDVKYKNFLPIAYTMPVFMLKHGFLSNLERITRLFSNRKIYLLVRDYLARVTSKETGFSVDVAESEDDAEYKTFINGRLINPEILVTLLKQMEDKSEVAIFNDSDLVYLKVRSERVKSNVKKINDLFLKGEIDRIIGTWDIDIIENKKLECVNYPWELIYKNSERIMKDYYTLLQHGLIRGMVDSGVYLIKKENIYIGEGSRVMSGSVIVAEDGPVIVDNGAKVMPNSVIYGPCYIGKKSLIKAGATIYEGTTIGEVSKVGGEVEESIIHSFSNKQHYGFLGHSYIGRWCNLGAGTSNSDLKNNYGNIKIQIGNEKIDTGKIFMGMLMGDHSKTAINTSINTGSVIGVMCNIFVRDFPDKYVPSFSWVGKTVERYDFDKAIQTARRVMTRRNKELTDDEVLVLRYIYEKSSKE